MSEFDAFARYYDADLGNFSDDLGFYRELARRTGGPILELMCGTGRVLLPLARAGFHVCGVDIAPQLLAIARRKLEQNQVLAQAELRRADVRSAALGGPFALAIVALNSLMHLNDSSEQLAALKQIHAALGSGGLLAIDLFNPDPRDLLRPAGELTFDHSFALADGTQVQKYISQSYDAASQTNHVQFIYDEIDSEGRVRRSTVPFSMRWMYRFELEHLLARAGFEIEMVYGSYELDEYRSDSPQLLTIARRL